MYDLDNLLFQYMYNKTALTKKLFNNYFSNQLVNFINKRRLWSMKNAIHIQCLHTSTHYITHCFCFSLQLQSRLPSAISRLLPGSGKYQVLYTDYDNFAIFWSCSNFGIAFTDQIWLLGREKDYSLEIRTKIYDALRQLGLDSDRLIVSKNKDCPNTL